MSKAQRTVEITAQLYRARNAAKFLLGEKYPEKMQEYGDLIKSVMVDKQTNAIGAATMLCKATANPYQQMEILAAAVEMIEPTEEAT